ncbi:MAG: hypothetical protein IPM27_08535 [Nitrosomonadales bacterium]|nr:hypothetical protein [Nitrosomonadales bacterium]
MQFQASKAEIKRAQSPHNLFIAGLFVFDLLMTPAVIALKIGLVAIFIPLVCSGSLLAYIYFRSKKSTAWFVDMHWRLAWNRSRLLLAGYGVSGLLILLSWLVSQTARDASMAHIMWTALTRISLVPTLIFVMVVAVLEASGLAMAGKGEVPDDLAAKFPPPGNAQA